MPRLDAYLVSAGLAPSRERAKALIAQGAVYVNGSVADKPSAAVRETDAIEVRGGAQFVSRGGLKLEHALDVFAVDVANLICVDVGASTGGFTDCLLRRGAARVFAVDVGSGQLAQVLRDNPRVVPLENVNARDMTVETLGGNVDFACADVSFISLQLILPAIRAVLRPGGAAVLLVKPQFEAGRGNVGKNGVVRDRRVHAAVLEAFIGYTRDAGFALLGLTHSPVRGGSGNIEFLALAGSGGKSAETPIPDVKTVVAQAHESLGA